MKKLLITCISIAALAISAQAQSAEAKVDIDVHASTLGHGVGFAIPVTENLAGRVSLNKFDYSYKSTSDGIDYDTTLKLESIAALADWHVFSGMTHLTAGLVYNNNSFNMIGIPTSGSIYNINGSPYTLTSLKAEITFNKIAPYLGFGWSGRASKTGLSFKSDFGVMFQGSPKSSLTATGSGAAAAAADLAAAQAQLDQDLSAFKVYPVISIGLGYAF